GHVTICLLILFILNKFTSILFIDVIIISPAPRSTLFPYTTLFRSVLTSRGPGLEGDEIVDGVRVVRVPVLFRRSRAVASFASMLDRKSTRLNSSHVKISYAVFCLKKKTELSIILFITVIKIFAIFD